MMTTADPIWHLVNQRIFDVSPIGILVVRADGTIAHANQAACRLFGYAPHEWAHLTVEDLLPPEAREQHVRHRAAYMTAPRTRPMGINLDLEALRKDGTRFPVEIALSHTELNGERVVLAFISDIRARKAAEEARERYAQRLRTLYEIEHAVLAAHSPTEVATLALKGAASLLPHADFFVFLFDETRQEAETLATYEGSGTPLPFRAGERISLAHPVEAHMPIVPPLPQQEMRPYLGLPLLVNDTLVGTLNILGAPGTDFGEAEIETLREIAAMLAIAIQQAQLREQLRAYAATLEKRVAERTAQIERRRRIAESLRDLVEALNRGIALHALLARVVEQASRLLHSQAAAIFGYDADQRCLNVLAVHNLPDEVARLQVPAGAGVSGRASQSGDVVVLHDMQQAFEAFLSHAAPLSPDARRALHEVVDSFQTAVALPLMVEGELFGTLALYFTTHLTLDDEMLALLRTFADQTTLIIENAHLRERVERAAVEAERNRIARDLHDSVTQTLFSASILADVIPRIAERNPDEAWRRLEELRQLTRGALAEMRTLLLELRPQALIEAPVERIFQHLADAAASRGRLHIETHLASVEMPTDVKVALYRIAQEALNNVIKHAHATHATLALTTQGDTIILQVTDDGRGFNPEHVPPTSFGLGIMRERAAAIGALFHVESQPGEGTTVRVHWSPSTPTDA
ncbi:MAG: PAS domain S-box protein [Ardenticatenia bacterium]|nr:MAG: PAS domain S-box protein [Ardenticatenia bacterium]